MRIIGFDTETHLGEEAACPCSKVHSTATPPWVCSSLSGGDDTRDDARRLALALCGEFHVHFVDTRTGEWGMVLTGPSGIVATRSILAEACDRYAGHYLGYDAGILANEDSTYIQALAKDLGYGEDGAHRARCTMLREQAIAVARDRFYGRVFGLSDCVKARFGVDISEDKKNPNSWRLRYAQLDGTPAAYWPDEALEYALMDAVWARRLYLAQAKPLSVDGNVVVDAEGNVMAELLNGRMGIAVLPWMRNRGIRVDPEAVTAWVSEVEAVVATGEQHARALGILRINRCGDCNGRGFTGSYPVLSVCRTCWAMDHAACLARGTYKRKATTGIGSIVKSAVQDIVTWMYEGHPPRTAPTDSFPEGQVATDADAFGEAPRTTDTIEAYVDTLFAKKQLSTYVPPTLAAAKSPARTIWSRPNCIVTSNRTSWASPNLTNPPRKGRYRECHVPREGLVMASLDFSSNELRTHAQWNIDHFGYSEMAKVLNDPEGDVYLDFAAKTLGLTYTEAKARLAAKDPVVKQARQTHKIAVLGYPGGLGARSFIAYARGYGVKVDKDTAYKLKADWTSAYPEMADHLGLIRDLSNLAGGGRFTMVSPRSGWVKGGCNYTSAANLTFQEMGAQVLKHAAWRCWLACFVDRASPMYHRVWPLIAIHDELIFEGDRATAHIWAPEGARLMVEAAEEITPNVKHYVEPALMERWLKGAEPVYDAQGRLVPWVPESPTGGAR